VLAKAHAWLNSWTDGFDLWLGCGWRVVGLLGLWSAWRRRFSRVSLLVVLMLLLVLVLVLVLVYMVELADDTVLVVAINGGSTSCCLDTDGIPPFVVLFDKDDNDMAGGCVCGCVCVC